MKALRHRAGKFLRVGAIALLAATWPVRGQEVGPSLVTPPVVSAKENQALGIPSRTKETHAGAPVRREIGSTSGWFGKTAAPLAGVLALIFVASRLVRSAAKRSGGLRAALGAGGSAPAGIMEILGRYPVGRGISLVLLKLDSRILLLSQSAGGRFGAGATFSTLTEISDPEEVASILLRSRNADGDSLAERFKTMLTRFDRRMDAAGAPAKSDPSELWDGSRSDIPIIDLTQRESPRRGPLRARLTHVKNESAGTGGGR